MQLMSMYDIPVEYDGKIVVLHSDPDRIIFLNHDNITWENGVPLSPEECVEYLRYYGKHGFTPVNKGLIYKDVGFFDCQKEYFHGYGLNIEFKDGEPQCKIEDGKILSTHIPCDCEKTYEYISLADRKKYDEFCDNLVKSGNYTYEGKQKDRVEYHIFRCNKCGTQWLFPEWDKNFVTTGMVNKKNHDAYMARETAQMKKGVRGLAINVIVLSIGMILAILLLAWVAYKLSGNSL